MKVSYIGTQYRGSQKHITDYIVDVDSIQGALESAILSMRPKVINFPNVVLSGRTDSGVHALCTAAHVDLANKYDFDYSEGAPLHLNRYLIKCRHDIRILCFKQVTDDFHARFSAKNRTYIYRFLVAKENINHKIPIAEINRTLHVRASYFDIEKVKNGIHLFKGKRDFQSFCSIQAQIGKSRYIKTIEHISLSETTPLMPQDPLSKHFNYYQITIKSKSFLYNQVRRMVATLLALGTNKLTNDHIETMLQVPSPITWHKYARGVPTSEPHGLYLANVEYDDEYMRL